MLIKLYTSTKKPHDIKILSLIINIISETYKDYTLKDKTNGIKRKAETPSIKEIKEKPEINNKSDRKLN